MILVALGSNRNGPWGNPEATVKHALAELDRNGIRLEGASRLMVTAPFGRPNQPPFVNAVARVSTHLPPEALLARLHSIEKSAGRRRRLRWGSRTLDLDIVDYHGLIRPAPSRLILPHPGIMERVFVLKPIAELAPDWIHPVLRESAKHLLRRLKGVDEGAEI